MNDKRLSVVSAWLRRSPLIAAAAAAVTFASQTAFAEPLGETSLWSLPRDLSRDGHRIDWLIGVTNIFVIILFVIMCIWMAWATASAQEVMRFSPKPEGLWQVMPTSCLTVWRAWTPLRQDMEMRRPRASHCEEAQPPALPMVVKSSKRPFSSSLMVT